jgi:hypothetical protein
VKLFPHLDAWIRAGRRKPQAKDIEMLSAQSYSTE